MYFSELISLFVEFWDTNDCERAAFTLNRANWMGLDGKSIRIDWDGGEVNTYGRIGMRDRITGKKRK